MKLRWYGWRSSFDALPWGWWPAVRWLVFGPVVIDFAYIRSGGIGTRRARRIRRGIILSKSWMRPGEYASRLTLLAYQRSEEQGHEPTEQE